MENKEIITDCLKYIDPSSLDYMEWCQVGMALKAEGYDCDIWDEWSRNDDRYKEGNCERKWNTFGNVGVTGATIVMMAKERGWEPERKGQPKLSYNNHSLSIEFSDEIPSENIVQEGWLETDEFKEPGDEWNDVKDASDYLQALFDPSDVIGYVMQSRFIPDKNKYIPADKGTYTVTCGQVLDELSRSKSIDKAFGTYDKKGGAWIRFNPLDGNGVKNDNVTEFKYALIESDNMDLSTQLAIINELKLPCAAIVYSGSKSVHAIVHIDAHSYSEYRSRVEYLFKICEKNGLSLDKQNKNPSRLSRLPGCYRGEHKQFLIGVNKGLGDYDEWLDYIDEIDDNLPNVDSLTDLFDNPPVLAPCVIDGILRQGRKMILSSTSKAGKTHLLIDLAFAFAEGMNWLGHRCKQCKVLYINLEVADDTFKKDVLAEYLYKGMAGAECHLENLVPWNLRGKAEGIGKIKRSIIRKAKSIGAEVIILDPLYKVMDGDENSNSDVGRMCREFDDIAQQTGASIIYAHHYAKGNSSQKSVIDRGAGAGAFARDPDAILSLTQLDWYSVNDPGKKAYRLESSLREFASIEPINIFSFGFKKEFKGKTYSTLVFEKDNDGILDDVDFLGEKPAKKSQYELADEKERTLRAVKELGGECTVYEFMDKYEKITGTPLKRNSAYRLLEKANLQISKQTGKSNVYQIKVEQV
jgi:regulatory protein RepA